MRKITLSLVAILSSYTTTYAQESDSINSAFDSGKIDAQIRVGYLYADPKISNHPSPYATAIGGKLKYETSRVYGFALGASFYTSHSISALSGEESSGRYNDELSTIDGHYDLLAEVYLDYNYQDFQIRIGRQLIDTPYADSDDIRMTPNTFEGVVARYSYSEIDLVAGYITKWQGPDAGIYEFVDLLDSGDGIAMVGATYESSTIESNLWYYYAPDIANVIYADAKYIHKISDDSSISTALQFANQSELDNSSIDATLYGAMAELEYSGFTLSIAYDKLLVDANREYFGGFGGGVGFVNMFEMTAGLFTFHQNATAWKGSIAYDLSTIGVDNLSISYDYGSYEGEIEHKANEQNLILTYTPSDNWNLEIVYDHIEDVDKDIGEGINGASVDGSLDRVLVRLDYNF